MMGKGKKAKRAAEEARAAAAEAEAATEERVEETPAEEPVVDPGAEWRDKYMRTLAELDNFRKRVERDREQTRLYASEKLLRALLPVIDDLELASAASADAAGGAEQIREGVELARKDLLRILKEHGFEPIESVGLVFDPRWHEAMGAVPAEDVAPGTIVNELQKGYRLHERVLRASRVQIAMQPPAPAPEADDPDTATDTDTRD